MRKRFPKRKFSLDEIELAFATDAITLDQLESVLADNFGKSAAEKIIDNYKKELTKERDNGYADQSIHSRPEALNRTG